MLIVGLIRGYYGRPLIGSTEDQAMIPRVGALQQSQGGTGNVETMIYPVSQAHHIKGDPDAPVTLIEFGDFQ